MFLHFLRSFTADKIYNLDESGNTNVHMPDKILACKGVKQIGSARVNYKDFMVKGAPLGSIESAHPSGWSNKTIFLQYLHHFIKHVNCLSNNKVLLILDNHESHINIEAINLAKENGIVMLTLPPHTSHKLQPIDRSIFGPYKTYYNTACADWMRCHPGKPISIYDVAEISGIAYPLVFTPTNIQSGFRVSGIWSFNQNIFQEHEFMGSSVTDRPYEAPSTSERAPSPPLASVSTTSIASPESNIVAVVSPEMLRPFPQAAPRTASARGRKKEKCRILTDTPEKMELEADKKSIPKTPKANKSIVKRKVLQSLSSSDDDDEDIVVCDDDSNLDAEDYFEIDTVEDCQDKPQK